MLLATNVWASVLPENKSMSGLFLAAGGREIQSFEDGERSYEIPVAKIIRSRRAFLERKQIERLHHR